VVIYQQQQIQQQLAQLQAAGAMLAPAPATGKVVAIAAPMDISVTPPMPSVPLLATEEVSYGEVPLSGARLERLRSVLDGLRAEHSKGELQVEVFLADFCLSGNAVSGYTPAADEALASRCDVIGNPFGDALTVQQRQSVAFANLVASVNSNPNAGLKVQLLDGGRKVLTAYPTPAAALTAATWNRIAERNQRVEYSLQPAP
jgi:hypothetical protein